MSKVFTGGANNETADLVQVNGSNTEVTAIDALAVTDTNGHNSTVVDVSDCSEFAVLALSTLDQSVNLSICQVNGHGSTSLGMRDGGGSAVSTDLTTANSGRLHVITLSNTTGPRILPFAVNFKLLLACATAPSSGSVSVWVIKRGKP